MPKNKTRVASEHGLLTSEARLNRVIKVDCMMQKQPPSWMLTQTEWDTHSEFEALMFVCQITSTQAQYKRLFLGAFAGVMKAVTLARLRCDAIPVLRYKEMTNRPKLVRPPKSVVDFTEAGKECLERIRLEGERRFCGNVTEVVDGHLTVKLGDGELLATLLDIRTVHCKHLSTHQRDRAMGIYAEEYVKFHRQADKFDKEAQEREEARTAGEEVAAERAPGTGARREERQRSDGLQIPVDAFISTTGDNRWSGDESEASAEEQEIEQLSDEEVKAIAFKVLRNFRGHKVDWRAEYPEAELPPANETIDIFKDLMHLNPGRIYLALEKKDKKREKYGLIPRMAVGSKGCIGFLPAASFCERCNSAAKDVMTDAHTLMGEEPLEMMVVLQMNRKFMEYMRSRYGSLTKEQFGMSLIEIVDCDQKMASS